MITRTSARYLRMMSDSTYIVWHIVLVHNDLSVSDTMHVMLLCVFSLMMGVWQLTSGMIHSCLKYPQPSHVVLYGVVDWSIVLPEKINMAMTESDFDPRVRKNVYNFVMTVRPVSRAYGHVNEILLILQNVFFEVEF